MPIDKEKLKAVLNTFVCNAEKGYDYPSELVKLSSNLNQNRGFSPELRAIYFHFKYLEYDIVRIETVTNRLEWERKLFDKDQLGRWDWEKYCEVDIDVFHVYMRSVFDYLARVIVIIAEHPKLVKKHKSFTKLRNWLTNEKAERNVKNLGTDLADLVLSVKWYDDLKNVRDNIVHEGADTNSIAEEGRILFQVSKDAKYLISFPEVQFNENLIDFELYAGVYFGYLISFLEEASKVIEKRLPSKKPSYKFGNPWKWYEELPAVYTWMKKVIEQT